MPKIINSIVFVTILTIFVFTPIIRAEAIYTYIGVKIDAAKRLSDEYGQMVDICLNATTRMSIISDDEVTTFNTVTTASEVCPDDGDPDILEHQIWSGLVDLTSGTSYKIKLEVPLCFGYWHKQTGYGTAYKCWYGGIRYGSLATHDLGRNESCTEICEDHNTTVADYGSNAWDENAGAQKALVGATCASGESTNSCAYGASTYLGGDNYCYDCKNCDDPSACSQYPDDKDVDYARVCICNYPTGVYKLPFIFTAP